MNTRNEITFMKIIKRALLTLLLCIALISLNSCKKIETIIDPIALGYIGNEAYIINKDNKTLSLNKYDEVLPIFDTYLMVKKDGKWGFIKNNGDEATKIEYSRVSPMKENKAVVEKDGDTYIINPSGDVLYTFSNGITSYSYFNENMLVIEKNGLLGYLHYNPETKKFSILVEPTYICADIFYEGFAAVGKEFESKNKDENGEEITTYDIKFSYVKSDGTLLYNEFIFDEADRFSCGLAKVRLESNDEIVYQFLKPTLNEENEPMYLTKKGSTTILKYDYATRFENNISFMAHYYKYSLGQNDDELSEDNQYYKSFAFYNTDGEIKYKEALDNYALDKPKNFLPKNPFFIDDIFIFIQGDRNASKWNILRHSTSQQQDIDDKYYEVYSFAKANWILTEDDQAVKDYIHENNCTYKLAVSYMTAPYEIGNITYNNTTNSYIAMSKIAGNKCGIIEITTSEITEPIKDVLDKYDVNIKYIVSTIYDNIVC